MLLGFERPEFWPKCFVQFRHLIVVLTRHHNRLPSEAIEERAAVDSNGIEWIFDADGGQGWARVSQDLTAVVDGPEAEHQFLWRETFRNFEFLPGNRVPNNACDDSHAFPFALADEILALFRRFVPYTLVANALLHQKVIGAVLRKELASGP